MRRALSCLGLIALVCAGCEEETATGPAGMPDMARPFAANCTVEPPDAESMRPAGRVGEAAAILPGGRRVTPAGRVLPIGGFPLAMRVLPGDRYAVVTDGAYGDEALRLVDLRATDPGKSVVSQVRYPNNGAGSHSPALFYGLALTRDGTRLYASNGGHDPVSDARPGAEHVNTIDVLRIEGSPPSLARDEARTIRLRFESGSGAAQQRLPAGMALSSDEKLLYVATQMDGSLAIVNVAPTVNGGPAYGEEIGRAPLPGIGPYDVVLDEAAHTAYVSLWGGQQTTNGPANGAIDGLAVVDITDPRAPRAQPTPLPTGKGAEGLVIAGGRLFVTNSDADSLSAIDLASRAVRSSRVGAGSLLGATPNAVAWDPGGGGRRPRLYVANAGENAVIALDAETLQPLGRVPAAWYPTSVAVLGDGTLLIASGKGLGLGPADGGLQSIGDFPGTLQVVPPPDETALRIGEQAVIENLDRPRQIQPRLSCADPGAPAFALPAVPGARSPIEHVILVVRENKTYDAVLGDLETGNGKPALALFGEEVTPNAHALSRAFVTVDNFYSDSEASLQGHEWTTACTSNDYAEKAWLTTWGRGYRPVGAFGAGVYERLALPGSDSIWTHLDKAHVDYANYGEPCNTGGALTLFDTTYPGVLFNLDILDVTKAAWFTERLVDPTFELPRFTYFILPNDHTYGTTPGKPTPASMVADNDEATGRIVDALSRSRFWRSSIVFVIEDDPQDGGDHVEPHRSVLLVASPWARRGARSSVNYDVASLYRTIELILGVGPMNANDGRAAAMYDLFARDLDATPHTFIPRKVPVAKNAKDAPLAEESLRIDFSRPDAGDLGRILWKAMRGRGAEPPWRRAPRAPDLDD